MCLARFDTLDKKCVPARWVFTDKLIDDKKL